MDEGCDRVTWDALIGVKADVRWFVMGDQREKN
jgi:hypothetical protein